MMFNLIKNSWFQKVLILGLLIRLLIMPFYYHPDIKTYHFQTSFLQKGVWDIYGYLDQKKDQLPLKEEFVYFPLTYFVLGSYQIIASPFLGPNFHEWLFNASAGNVANPEVFKYLFILKFPYLLIDILIAFLLTGFFENIADKKKVFALWLLNPFSIFIIYVFSNVDILVVLTTVLSLFLAAKKRFLLAAISLGFGMGFKAYPLFFLPLLFFYAPTIKQKTLVLLGGLGTIGVIIGPFLLSKPFQSAALVSGLTTRILIPQIDIGFNEAIIVPVLLLTIYIGWFSLKEKKIVYDLFTGFLSIILLTFSFIHFHIQWLLWFMPFACLVLVRKPKLLTLILVLVFAGILVPMLYDDKYMNVALLSVISSSYNLLPNLFTVVQKVYDPYVIQSLVQTIFAGLSLVLIFLLLRDQDEV